MTSFGAATNIFTWAETAPTRQAVICEDRCLSYGALATRVARVANGSRGGLSLEEGARTAILAPNCLEYAELLLGLSLARTPPVLLNIKLSPAELRHICADSDVRAVFVHPSLRHLLEEIGLTPDVRVIVLGQEYEDWLSRASAARPPGLASDEDLLCVPYTGGTTSKPKGVLLSHRARALMYKAMADVFPCYTSADRNLTISPMFHGAGFNFCLATLYSGGTAVLLPAFDSDRLVETVERQAITHASVVPTHLVDLLAQRQRRVESRHLRSLKAVISNGAPLPVSMKETVCGLLGANVLFDAYGSTEAGVISVLKPGDQFVHPTSVGTVFPGLALRLLDDAGGEVADGALGEVQTRSAYLFSGYSGSSERFDESHWFAAGDIGRLQGQYLYLVDRKGEKIVTGGINVFPAEVESAIADHPAVAEVAVFGIPDPYWGEAVHAAIALKPGMAVSAEELKAFLAARIARFKVPKSVAFAESLPKSAAGKVLRRELRDAHWGR